MNRNFWLISILGLFLVLGCAKAEESEDSPKVDEDIGKAQEASKTDDEVVQR